MLFAPTSQAVTNLKLEGLQGRAVYLTGDVMLDAAILFTPLAERESTIRDRLDLKPAGYVLATIHRPENTQDPDRLRAVIEGLKAVATKIRVILPAHPRTRAAIARDGISTDGIVVIDPVGYLDMLALQGQAAAIATDSGGLQKEAFFQRIPCVTLRTETEWVELVDLRWNRLAPPFSSAAVSEAILSAIGTTGLSAEPYGNGDASTTIAEILSDPIATDHPARSESGTGSEGRWRS
jgi:UDP-GlcNAc3NAcA epimerase